jgi:protein TonB
MADKKRRSLQHVVGLVSGIFFLIMMCGIVIAVKMLIGEGDEPQKERIIENVSLIKEQRQPPPPPPKKIEEPPPEPVAMKPEETVKAEQPEEPKEVKQEETPPEPEENQHQDDRLADASLGVDAAGGGTGSDAFGLLARKGGKSLTEGGPVRIGGGGRGRGGNGSEYSPMKKYAWYTRMLEGEIKRRMLIQGDGIPSGKLQVLVKIVLDEQGGIVNYQIYDSSGNNRMDEAVNLAMEKMQTVSSPPPEGMPRAIKLRISLAG